jgi:tetratricopeptide (TPR) repeat protein
MERAFVVFLALASISPAVQPVVSDGPLEGLCAARSARECAVMANNLGSKYFSAGKYRDAEALFTSAIALWAGNSDFSLDLAKAYHNLAAVYRAEGRYSDSASVFQSALDLRETLAGPSDLSLVPILNEYGLVELHLANLVQAEHLLRRALQIVRLHQAEPTTVAADVMNNLAIIDRETGRMQEAEELYGQALDVYRHTSDAEREVKTLNNLGRVFAEQAQYKEAERLYREAMAVAESRLGSSHPGFALGIGNLGKLLIERGKYKEAEPLLRRAEQIDRASLSPGDARIGFDLDDEAIAAAGRRHYADAESLYQHSQAILAQALAPKDPEIGKVDTRLAAVYAHQKRWSESEELFRRGINILKQAWGPENPQLLNILESYEALLRSRQEYAEAESAEVQATRIRVVEALRNSNQ